MKVFSSVSGVSDIDQLLILQILYCDFVKILKDNGWHDMKTLVAEKKICFNV